MSSKWSAFFADHPDAKEIKICGLGYRTDLWSSIVAFKSIMMVSIIVILKIGIIKKKAGLKPAF